MWERGKQLAFTEHSINWFWSFTCKHPKNVMWLPRTHFSSLFELIRDLLELRNNENSQWFIRAYATVLDSPAAMFLLPFFSPRDLFELLFHRNVLPYSVSHIIHHVKSYTFQYLFMHRSVVCFAFDYYPTFGFTTFRWRCASKIVLEQYSRWARRRRGSSAFLIFGGPFQRTWQLNQYWTNNRRAFACLFRN